MAQTRYRTLLSHMTQVFQADEGRTRLLQEGLDDIVVKIDPKDAKSWQLVKQDSERLLRIWFERDRRVMMEQVLGALSDYATAEKEEDLPKLVITPWPRDALTPLECGSVQRVSALPVASAAPVHIVEGKDSKVDDEAEAESVVEPEEAEAESVVEPEEAEAEAESVAEPEEAEAEAESVVEPEEAEAEEEAESVVEPEEEAAEEEEEEEGMEVDKVVIRGRPYWMDTKTKKLYAIVGDDDVGDEVGAIVNGKAVFIG